MFNSLSVGDLIATGNVTFTGNITEVATEHILIKDNIVDINADNAHPLMLGGISIQRGPGLTPFDIMWNENERLLKIGLGKDALRAVATREDVPTNNWLAVWNTAESRFDTTDVLSVPLTFQHRLTLQKELAFTDAQLTLSRNADDLVIATSDGDVLFAAPSSI